MLSVQLSAFLPLSVSKLDEWQFEIPGHQDYGA